MTDRIQTAVTALKQAKSEGLTYHDAAERLSGQGFSQDEIAQAAYQFPYNTEAAVLKPSASGLDQAFAQGAIHQEAVDRTKAELHKSFWLGLLTPGIFGRYFGTKTVSKYAALRDLQEQSPLGEPKKGSGEGDRVVQRNRAVRYFAILSLIALLFSAPSLVGNMGQLVEGVSDAIHHRGQVSSVTLLLAVTLAVCATSIGFVVLLFSAKQEATIRRGIYCLLGLGLLPFAVLAVLSRSPAFLIAGALATLPEYWISRQVGLLSQVS